MGDPIFLGWIYVFLLNAKRKKNHMHISKLIFANEIEAWKITLAEEIKCARTKMRNKHVLYSRLEYTDRQTVTPIEVPPLLKIGYKH